MQNYTLSVVTICYNNLEELEQTIASVDKQKHLPEEHLIIDGSSNQAIKNYLQHSQQPNYRRWIHEADGGISDAFNKGVLNAKGEIIHLLNSGDYYYDELATKKAMEAFTINRDLQWLHGQFVQYRGATWVTSGTPFQKQLLYKGMRQLGHQTFFVKKKIYEKHGMFDLSLRMAMDYDFVVRIANEKSAYIEYPLTVFTPGGVSSQQYKASLKEVQQVYEKYFGFSFKVRLWMLRSYLLAWFTNETGLGKTLFQLKNSKEMKDNS